MITASTKLAKCTITDARESFTLYIEDEAAKVLELSATRDQIDLIDEALEQVLAKDDSADEIK